MLHRHLKAWLIGLTLAAVVSDSMLLPFYPHFFATVFGVTNPQHVGLYLSASCLAVILALPLWARLVRRTGVLNLLVYTQVAAGALCLLCYWTDNLTWFWLISMAMLVFKASYLLIYPLILASEHPDRHGGTIGLLSVVVHLGGIAGAVLGGAVLQWFEPRQIFLVMAASDVLQTATCLYLLRSDSPTPAGPEARPDPTPPGTPPPPTVPFRLPLGLVMFAFYFSAYLIRPFFVRHWEHVSDHTHELVSGLVFAIPAGVAVLALWINLRRATPTPGTGIVPALVLAAAGLLVQGLDQPGYVLLGRVLFGWGLFQATVRLDQLMFALSTLERYAADYSTLNLFQQMGVLVAALTAGALVESFGLANPFVVGAAGLVVTAGAYMALVRPLLTLPTPDPARSPS
ncbi:MFS transporter [Marinobacter arenosus]|uniref:MFS transporter n=1 Tax=Marinobacter arenosus TaxID=2856822 RepID=UPI001C4C3AAC|nr:MFS transporter [Marinobacter arenosus]MBW0148089.1 MFS transporter [Marinobacter arenosus]